MVWPEKFRIECERVWRVIFSRYSLQWKDPFQTSSFRSQTACDQFQYQINIWFKYKNSYYIFVWHLQNRSVRTLLDLHMYFLVFWSSKILMLNWKTTGFQSPIWKAWAPRNLHISCPILKWNFSMYGLCTKECFWKKYACSVREARIHVRHVRDLLKSVDSSDAYGGQDGASLAFLNSVCSNDIERKKSSGKFVIIVNHLSAPPQQITTFSLNFYFASLLNNWAYNCCSILWY